MSNSIHWRKRFLRELNSFSLDVAGVFFSVEVGLLKFVDATVKLSVQCLGFSAGIKSGTDFIFTAADDAFQGFTIMAAVDAQRNGIDKRDGSNSTIPASIPYWEFHIGHPQSPEFADMIRNGLRDTDWIHMATITKYLPHVHTIHVKHADKSVLGPGPRSEPVFHLRVTEQHNMTSTSKRDEGTSNGLVFDYLWNQGVPLESELTGGSVVIQVDDWGSNIAKWMEEHSSEANCASLAVLQAEGPGKRVNLPRKAFNRGLAAFGWNNAPFGFNGRAGGGLISATLIKPPKFLCADWGTCVTLCRWRRYEVLLVSLEVTVKSNGGAISALYVTMLCEYRKFPHLEYFME